MVFIFCSYFIFLNCLLIKHREELGPMPDLSHEIHMKWSKSFRWRFSLILHSLCPERRNKMCLVYEAFHKESGHLQSSDLGKKIYISLLKKYALYVTFIKILFHYYLASHCIKKAEHRILNCSLLFYLYTYVELLQWCAWAEMNNCGLKDLTDWSEIQGEND